VHFPCIPADGARDLDEEFFAQMTRECLVVRRQGFTEWEKPKAAREAGVRFVYAYAAVTGLQAMHPRYVALGKQAAVEPNASLEESTASGAAPPPPAPPASVPRPLPPRYMPPRRGDFSIVSVAGSLETKLARTWMFKVHQS
jgi:terminase, large subunit